MGTKTKAKELSEAGRQQVALALILLKDYKGQSLFDLETTMMIIDLADHLGVRKEFDKLLSIVPPMRVEERYP